jgi:asparagine synthase (glutamine-hydrolysing)
MCAINGIISWHGIQENHLERVKKSLLEMEYRGPDFSKIETKNKVSLGHNRLSIVDLNYRSNQPMGSEDGRYSIVFNGEIYNYKSIKKELIGFGINFYSESDTEVLLKGYIFFKEKILQKIRGMFSFAIWDNQEEELFIARDRFGEKPFYYVNSVDKEFLFASNLSGIVELYSGELNIDKEAVFQLLNQQYIDNDVCIYKGINKLSPGHYIVLNKNNFTINKFWNLDYRNKVSVDFNSAKIDLHDILKSSVEEQLQADVPVGVFLSGGVDSTVVTSIASKQKKNITALTISTPDDINNDESKAASYVAKTLNINHKIVKLNKSCVNDLPYVLKNIEPLADASLIPSTAITKEAKKEFTVMLSGDGGDEVFGGYGLPIKYNLGSFTGNAFTTKIIKSLIQTADNSVTGFLYDKLNTKRLFKWGGLSLFFQNTSLSKTLRKELLNNYKPRNLNSTYKHYIESLKYSNKEEDSLLYVGVKSKLVDDFLLKLDSSSMINSIESRAPLLDVRLIEYTSKMTIDSLAPNNVDKQILKEIGSEYINKDFFNLPKKGFSIPYYNYLKNNWGDILLGLVKEGVSSDLNILNPIAVEKLLSSYRRKPTFRIGKILYSILVLEIWLRVFHLKQNPEKISLV